LRQRILTDREREILETYIREGVKLDGFSVLKFRSQRFGAKLKEELDLIQAALKRSEEKEKHARKK
jgi:hypothetical protein